MNESIYYNVDTLHEAISEGKKISFKYFEYNVKKEQVYRKGGALYVVSPAALTWNEENYYLVAFSDEREGIIHFRVDRMSGVKIINELRHPDAVAFRLADYSKKVFGMFGGQEADVRLRVNNQITGAVIDRFGKEVIMVPDGKSHFIVTVRVVLSPIFYGWLFQFGELCEVLSPQSLKDELKTRAKDLLTALS
jgi:predicted DNA-binding transcriptional regulator YafY